MEFAAVDAGAVALITARGGSKGVPGKNVRPLAGRPLIAWTIAAALAARRLSRVMVSTDSEEIAAVARRWGADVPFLRPAELAGDTSAHLDVVLHALAWLAEHEGARPTHLVTLQPTSPLRTADDIDGALELAERTGAAAVVSVCPLSPHPYLAKRLDADGVLHDFLPIDLEYRRRQDFPPAYALNGAVYVNRVDALRAARTMFPRDTRAYVMPEERSLDIDTLDDFALAQWRLAEPHARHVA